MAMAKLARTEYMQGEPKLDRIIVRNMTCLNKPDISVPKLLSKHLAILGCYGSLSLSSIVKINKSLHTRGLMLGRRPW